MSEQLDLAALFGSIAQELETDRTYLNTLDGRNGNTGDNMAQNFRLVSDVLAQMRGQRDGREALMSAAEALQQQGRGRTASLYASGLAQAANNLPSGSLTIDDLMPLLEGLLGGVQQSSGAKQGEGTLLDALIPGVLGYMQAKRRGASDMEAILDALTSSRRGTYGGSYQQPDGRESSPFGGGQQPSTPRQPDPGAAGVGSLLEGLFRGLLQGGAGNSNPSSGPDLFKSREPKARV